MYTIALHNLEFYGHHGVPDEEQRVGHRYRLTLRMSVEGQAPDTDSIQDTVDYGEVCRTVLDISERRQFRTMEGLAKAFGTLLLEKFEGIQSLVVELEKLHPPGGYMLGSSSIEMELWRE